MKLIDILLIHYFLRPGPLYFFFFLHNCNFKVFFILSFNSLVKTNIGKEFNTLVWVYLVYSLSLEPFLGTDFRVNLQWIDFSIMKKRANKHESTVAEINLMGVTKSQGTFEFVFRNTWLSSVTKMSAIKSRLPVSYKNLYCSPRWHYCLNILGRMATIALSFLSA